MTLVQPVSRQPAYLRRLLVCAAALSLAPAASVGQFGGGAASQVNNVSLLDDVFEARSQRLQGVNIWVERLAGLDIPGLGAMPNQIGRSCTGCVAHQVEEIVTGNSGPRLMDRVLATTELMRLAGLGGGSEMGMFGIGLMGIQAAINPSMQGVVPSLPDPWIDPYRMFGVGGEMVLAGAQAMAAADASLATSNQQVQQTANEIASVIAGITDGGYMTLADGRQARVFSNPNLSLPIPDLENGQSGSINSASAYIDEQQLVMIGHRLDGTMTDASGASRAFFIEILNSDYRQVPGCNLYEPYRRVVRMGGMLDAAQQAEMQEATAQLAEFEAQLAAMPPAQRAMMESMMGSQMDMVRNMANGGAIEHVQEVEEIICNPDLAALYGGAAAPGYDLAQIQRDLVTLGYMPGNTDGVLDVLTEVAISQYEAERGMPVTGQPSTQLQLALANEAAE